MKNIKIIKKIKANLIRFKVHKFFGFTSDILIYFGYLLKMSKWLNKIRSTLMYDDFYNKKVVHKDRLKLYEFLTEEKKLNDKEITYLEFGVGRGNSMTWWVQKNLNPNSTFWGFDTFEGLPEKYGTYEVGTFSLKGRFPAIKDDRIIFVKGLFQSTLLNTISKIDFNKSLILHLDSDLYSSTIFPLAILYPYLKKGDIIIFDEFAVPYHEFKAFDDFIKSFHIILKPIGAINNYLEVCFEIEQKGIIPPHNGTAEKPLT